MLLGLLCAFSFTLCYRTNATHSIGGRSVVADATSEIQDIVQSVKPTVEKHLHRSLPIYWAISYRSQVAAGKNYFIKVKPTVEERLHRSLPIYRATSHRSQLENGTNYFIKVLRERVITDF
ncbi:stefin-C-like isoform X2 [Stegostoma tigrinum]|uniref:stefin-C-like isoform X2 n=1 Tax=Stegostoma tigrinum TaxID=3053191 RepID=UPI0028708170|nr:stefin-C-like isoform X2 [Stegostoma tigrinum]